MSVAKYYWIRLKSDFFDLETIDWLISQKNGCEYVVLYQKLCLLTANKNGELSSQIGDMIVPYDANKIARDTKFNIDTVIVALELFKQIGLIYEQGDGIFKIPYVEELVGSETEYARKKREYREKKAIESGTPKLRLEAKSDAERQKAHRAKKACEEKQHVPHIETHTNQHRYGGNYYIVMKRDKFKCAMCGSIEKLCVHHIDGFDENKPENNAANKMIVLCRRCHGTAHSSENIPQDILDSIDYYDSNVTENVFEMSETKDSNVSDKRKSIEIEKDKDKDKENKSIDYQAIISAYADICTSFPSCKALSDARKKAIKARLNSGYTYDDFVELFKKAQASDFLKGKNNRDWRANFDWLIKDANMAKVLDGNYDNKGVRANPSGNDGGYEIKGLIEL